MPDERVDNQNRPVPSPAVIPHYARPSEIPDSEYRQNVLGWCGEAIQEGEDYLKSDPGFRWIDRVRRYVDSESESPLDDKFSATTSNHLSRIALNLVSGLTDVKPFWQYESHNRDYERTAKIHNDLAGAWWQDVGIDQRNADAIRWAVVAGSSYLEPFWDETIQDLNARAWDPRDVLPVRPADKISVQNAMGVILRKERTVNYLKSRYPKAAPYITADRDGFLARATGHTRVGRLLHRLNSALSPFNQSIFGNRPHDQLPSIPTADLFTLYVTDNSVNGSDQEILMGDPRANWSYRVPPGGKKYPRKRLIIFTRTVIIYDGPSTYFHGMFPLAKLTLDPWPWTWLGKSPLRDSVPLQESLNRTLRVIDDRNARLAHPPLIMDKNSISKTQARGLNTRKPGLMLLQNMLAGKGAQIVHEPAMDQYLAQYPDWIIDQMETLSGAKDLSSLMTLNQLPTVDTIEKILQSMSPANRQRSRVMESYISQFAMMTLSNFFQFYTRDMREAVLGPRGLLPEDYDRDRDNVIPALMDGDGSVVGEIRPLADRAQEFLRRFRFSVVPGSLLESASVDRKLMYLQLARMGLVDHWTLLEELGIPNVGEPPEGADTISERLMVESAMGMGLNISPVGRKATAQAGPRLTVKES